MVFRVFVEKKKELAFEAKSLLSDINSLLLIDSVKKQLKSEFPVCSNTQQI